MATIRETMDKSLQLLNQYSIVGAQIPLTYNDQQDDELRMIGLINDAMMEIATVAKPITEFETFEVEKVPDTEPTKNIEHLMPPDIYQPISVRFTPACGGPEIMVEANKYKWLGEETLLVPNRPAGTYVVEYSRYPAQYNLDTNKNTRLDNTPDTHSIIPYFVAAMIALDDNQKAYYALYNVWETRLSRLNLKNAHAVITQVEDVYGF